MSTLFPYGYFMCSYFLLYPEEQAKGKVTHKKDTVDYASPRRWDCMQVTLLQGQGKKCDTVDFVNFGYALYGHDNLRTG